LGNIEILPVISYLGSLETFFRKMLLVISCGFTMLLGLGGAGSGRIIPIDIFSKINDYLIFIKNQPVIFV